MKKTYTTKKQVEAVAGPLFDFAMDIVRYHQGPPPHHNGMRHLLMINGYQVSHFGFWVRSPAIISNHRRLLIETMLEEKITNLLDGFRELVEHIPPMSKLYHRSHRLEIRHNARDEMALHLYLDSIPVCLTESRSDFIQSLYVFLRTHENIEMGPDLEAYHLISAQSDLMRGVCIHADSEDNALLRFAACSPEVRKRLRRGEALRCAKLAGKAKETILAALKGRTRKAPAPPQSWTMT